MCAEWARFRHVEVTYVSSGYQCYFNNPRFTSSSSRISALDPTFVCPPTLYTSSPVITESDSGAFHLPTLATWTNSAFKDVRFSLLRSVCLDRYSFRISL